jgi:hypothetical protein
MNVLYEEEGAPKVDAILAECIGNSNRIFHPTTLYWPLGAPSNRITIFASPPCGPKCCPSQHTIACDPHPARAQVKANLVLVDLSCPQMQPARDPLRSFVYHAADRAVRDVFVNGHRVVADGKVTTLDQQDAAARVAEAQRRIEAAVPGRDYLGRSATEIAPLSLPVGD